MQEDLREVMSWSSPVTQSRPTTYNYASSASAVVTGPDGKRAVHGECLRKQYFRRKSIKENKLEGENHYNTGWLGNAIHEATYDRFRAAGAYVDSEVPMWDPIHKISGRADLFYRIPTQELAGADIKSKWGYHGEIGYMRATKTAALFPSIADVLQSAVYLDHFKQFDIKKWGIFYVHRGNGVIGEHYVMLPDFKAWRQMGAPLTEEQKAKEGRIEVINLSGSTTLDVSIEDVYERWDTLDTYLVTTNALPPADYQLQYSEETLKEMLDSGELAKTPASEFKKKGFVKKGDWRCQYCSNSATCWTADQWHRPIDDKTILENMQ